MPKVGSKSFAYTPAGKKAAAKYAKSTGQSVSKAYKKGGKVKKQENIMAKKRVKKQLGGVMPGVGAAGVQRPLAAGAARPLAAGAASPLGGGVLPGARMVKKGGKIKAKHGGKVKKK